MSGAEQAPDQPPSLRRRLAIGLSLSVCVFWLLATAVAGLIVRHEIAEVFDSAMQEVVQRVLPLAYSDILARDGDDTIEQQLPDVGKHAEYITYVVRDDRGRVLLRSHDADQMRFPGDLKPGFEDREGLRFYTEAALRGTLTVSAMERPGHRTSTLTKAMIALALPLALLLPAVLLAVFWLVKRALRPVNTLGEAIAGRGDNNLAPVPSDNLPAEIRPVGLAVNTLLARLRRALEAERSFTANSAHEMRTPIAGALARTQQIIAAMEPDQNRDRMKDVEASLQRMARLTEKLLQLAKADGGLLRSGTPQDLATVIPYVLADIAGADRVTTELPATPVLSTLDVDVFAIAVRNLVENALKYGTAGATVGVRLSADGVLDVENKGPVLTQEDFARLRQRFERGVAGVEGAGLGLAIVDAIARGAGGDFSMISPLPNREGGISMRLALPLS